MRIVDLNLLLYAINSDSPVHAGARKWLEGELSGGDLVGLPWVVLLGFLRITTNPRVMAKPLSDTQAVAIIDGWLQRPCVRIIAPGQHHWPILRKLLEECGTAGNLTTDAHLAALAIERGCELCSTDSDFARFANLRWVNPL